MIIFSAPQITEEAVACRKRAALFNLSNFGKFYLTGKDARKAVDWICTADINRPVNEFVIIFLLLVLSVCHYGHTQFETEFQPQNKKNVFRFYPKQNCLHMCIEWSWWRRKWFHGYEHWIRKRTENKSQIWCKPTGVARSLSLSFNIRSLFVFICVRLLTIA